MDLERLNGILLPLATAAFFLLGMAWPTWRTWRRTGVWPVTLHRVTDPTERLIGRAMGAIMAAIVGWTAAYALAGAAPLAIWNVPSEVVVAGWTVMLAGLAVLLVAQAQMGASWRVGIDTAATPLVTGGLFGVVRNPIFSAMGAMLVGFALATPSPWTVLGALHALTIIALQTRLEERHLEGLHGAAYVAYAARVGRFLPGLGRLRRG